MKKKDAVTTRARRPAQPSGVAVAERDDEYEGGEAAESATPSATALAGEAMATGVLPLVGEIGHAEIPGEDEKVLAGDRDESALGSAHVGDTTPGGHASTPDQGGVDDVGRAYGVQEEDSGELRTSSELLDARDRHRQELDPPARPRSAYETEPDA